MIQILFVGVAVFIMVSDFTVLYDRHRSADRAVFIQYVAEVFSFGGICHRKRSAGRFFGNVFNNDVFLERLSIIL